MEFSEGKIILGLVSILVIGLTFTFAIEHHTILEEKYGSVAELFISLIATCSFVVGGFISLMFHWGIDVINFNHLLKLLPPNEMKVMKLLFERKRILQSDLTAHAGLSRLRVSRILSKLEKKKIIVKESDSNKNMIESKLYQNQAVTQIISRLPGFTEGKMIIAIALIFFLGILLSILNSYHILKLEHPLTPIMYVIALESFALGAFIVLVFRKRISQLHFNRSLQILERDEQEIIRLLHEKKTMIQADLVEATGINKMKVSRVIWKFNKAGVLEKKPYGNTNLLFSRI